MPDNSKISYKYMLVGFLVVLLGSNLINYFMFGYKPVSPLPEQPSETVDYSLLFPEAAEELSLFTEALNLLTGYYFEPVEVPILMRGAIKGMLQTLEDPQTTFYDPEDLENFLQQTMGASFGGIGVRIVDVEGSVIIFETIPGTPAERAGLYPGDRISGAAGEDLAGQGLDRAVELLRGPKGTTVTISVDRPGADEPLLISLERDEIKMVTVSSRMLDSGLGYLKISSFDSNTGADFALQFQALEQEGLEQGLILDLRNNTGGLVDESIKVAKLLVPEGEITRLVDRDGQARNIHYSSAPARPYPIVVLVNEETASAAEIVAGALQDRGAALLVGVQTYGKATVQHLEQLPGGNALRMTIARYRTPSGKDLHGQGLEPDYPVELSMALKYYRYFLPGRLVQGSYGGDVELLQSMLAELGYSVSAEGYFDETTARALASFQEEAGITASGAFDDLTWIHLRQQLDQVSREHDYQLDKAIELTTQPGLWADLGR